MEFVLVILENQITQKENWVIVDKLKAEAIKRWKKLDKECGIITIPTELDRRYGKMELLEELFNLTEEDLK